jgi:hypothetical protein
MIRVEIAPKPILVFVVFQECITFFLRVHHVSENEKCGLTLKVHHLTPSRMHQNHLISSGCDALKGAPVIHFCECITYLGGEKTKSSRECASFFIESASPPDRGKKSAGLAYIMSLGVSAQWQGLLCRT